MNKNNKRIFLYSIIGVCFIFLVFLYEQMFQKYEGFDESLVENVLFIGANDMEEVEQYVKKYKSGLFIEAVPTTYERLKTILDNINKKYNTNYIAINALVSNEAGKEYTFNIFNNDEKSSSIFESNSDVWLWNDVEIKEKIPLISTTIENILQEYNWESVRYDVILDVQGAELLVLQGFGQNNFKNINTLTTEISKKEYYKGGVLFDTLNDFLISKNMTLTKELKTGPDDTHYDAIYTMQS